jgi:ADP-ribose pyrophosphatase YjhB (NUDIX family)
MASKDSPLTDAVCAFMRRLTDAHRAALQAHQPLAHQPRPAHGVRWYWQDRLLGWMPEDRAQRICLALPGAALQTNTLHWSGRGLNPSECGTLIQSWLEQEHLSGHLQGWRNEAYHCWDGMPEPPEPSYPVLFTCERAGFLHLGLTSHAVHTNGFTAEGNIWCGRRSLKKPTDPGMLDNLSAGGLAAGETIWDNLHKELFEEAGLRAYSEHQFELLGRVHAARANPQGWHDEVLWVFNGVLTYDQIPKNQDGEVSEFNCFTPNECMERMLGGEFTQDAALALRCGLGCLFV